MNRAERRRKKRNDLKNIPDRIKQQRENMAVAIVTAAIETLAEDFGFTQEQLELFNDKLQERALKMVEQ